MPKAESEVTVQVKLDQQVLVNCNVCDTKVLCTGVDKDGGSRFVCPTCGHGFVVEEQHA